MRWIGIDEAGYGPNLGPLVMTAVAADGPDDRPPDLWADLAASVCRAGETGARLWVDDSKRIYSQGKGFDRLEAAALAALDAAGLDGRGSLIGLLDALGVPVGEEAELSPWLAPGADLAVPRWRSAARVEAARRRRPFDGCCWKLAEIRCVVVGPWRFNRLLTRADSKAEVHFDAFARLLGWACDRAADGRSTFVRGDKHGGRHFYGDALRRTFPDARVEPRPRGSGPEPLRDHRRRPSDRPGVRPPRRRRRRAGGPGLDRQQARPRALDGRLQRLLDRSGPRPEAHRRLSRSTPPDSAPRSWRACPPRTRRPIAGGA